MRRRKRRIFARGATRPRSRDLDHAVFDFLAHGEALRIALALRSDYSAAMQDDSAEGAAAAEAVHAENIRGLTPYQLGLLETVRECNTKPIVKSPNKSTRSPSQIAASQAIHKRVNSGYVDIPYESSNSRDFKYRFPPDFTREYLKSDSDLHFAKFAAAALKHSVPLNKTSH